MENPSLGGQKLDVLGMP